MDEKNMRKIPMVDIPKGHARLRCHYNKEMSKGIFVIGCSGKYHIPGYDSMLFSDEMGEYMPIVAIKIHDSDTATVYAEAFKRMAEILKGVEKRARKN